MIKNNHNQFVSTPNWFTSVVKEEPKQQQVVQIITSNSANSPVYNEGIQQNEMFLNIYNKSLIRQNTISSADLMFDGKAISINPETLGQTVVDELWGSTTYLEIIPNSLLTITTSYDYSAKYGIAFYDLSKKPIKVIPVAEDTQKIIVPANTRYFRACSKNVDYVFNAVYMKPASYTPELLATIYNGDLNSFTELVQPFQESITLYSKPLSNLSLVVDDPLKLEIDSNGNLHININNLTSGLGNYVTTTSEPQDVRGIKTFEKGIGIGDYMIVPDTSNDAIKIVHKDKSKLGNLYTTGWLSALGAGSNGSSGGASANALYQLTDVLDDNGSVLGAKEGSILKYDGTHWYGAEDEGLDIQRLQKYLSDNQYITLNKADSLFLTPEEADELFLTQDDGDARYLIKEIFSKIFTAYDTDGNIVDITSDDSIINQISVNYDFWSKGFVSALGKQKDSTYIGGATALYQLTDVLSDNDTVMGAKEGAVLVYNGTHWYADENAKFDTNLLQTYLNNNQYLNIFKADTLYLNKTKDDRSSGFIASDKGIEIGNFNSGLIGGSGAKIYKDVHDKTVLEIDKIYGREELIIPKITYNCTDIVTGETAQTFAFGEVKEVTTNDDGTGTISLELLEDEYGTVHENDICRGVFHFIDGNATEYSIDANGFHQYSGFSTTYFTPTTITINEAGRMEFVYSLQEGTAIHPCKGMKFYAYGNFFDKNRQSIVYHTREYTRMLTGVDQWVIEPDKHIAKQDGNLDQLQIGGQKMEGYSSFQKNVYLTGSVIEFTPQQKIELKGEGAYAVSLSTYVGTLRFNEKGELNEERHTEQELEYYLRTTIQATRGTTELFYSDDIVPNAFSAAINPVGCTAILVNGTIFVTSIHEGVEYAYVEVDVSCEGYTTYHLNYEIKSTKDGISPLTLVSSYTSVTRNSLGAYEPSNILIRCIRGKSEEKAHLAVFGTKQDDTKVRLSLDDYETYASSWDFNLESVSSYDFKSMTFRVYSNGLPNYPTVEEDYNTIADAEVGVNFVSDGVEGPMPRNCGKFDITKHYYYTHEFRDFVWNNSTSSAKVYIRKSRYATVGDEEGAICGVDVTDTDYWEEVPRETLTAIDTALIDTANIAGFMFRNGKMVSQETGSDPLNEQSNLILDGKNGIITAQKGVFKGDLYGRTVSFEALSIDENGVYLLPEIKGRYGMFYIENAVSTSSDAIKKTYKAFGTKDNGDRIVAITGATSSTSGQEFSIVNQETLILFSTRDAVGDYWAATKIPYWIFGREFSDSVANIQEINTEDEAIKTDVLYIITG